ncbi:MAG TPA: thioredoxin domain-containing protein [Steroidobacteraceae bacterium]|nr:thioredoxin domain-containing protein [Steroidobacteraceae bacterium]
MQPSDSSHSNRLARETSPYLRQHAANPVEWYAWGAEALERARREDKPILLSIGYSACHWCHVMAHESFEDPETARLMNELFVNIKVDREERPDLDRIYQIAHQMLAQRGGGWPLTMFLTPEDQKPFFGGTYFPKEPRYGMPAFTELLQRVARYYREQPAEIHKQNAALGEAFESLYPPLPRASQVLTDAPLMKARTLFEDEFDGRFGGFGAAPKFPHPATIERLLRHWHATAGDKEPDLQALYMATLTLKRMAEGGLNDQVGGGFSRYSVDQYWMIPHFEKMLYDNGPLLALYAQAAIATGDGFFAHVAADTAAWALREMHSPEGGFYSSLDADSEGHEGKFYVWDKAEIQRALDADQYRLVERRYGLDRSPNFEGRWHLHAFESLDKIAAREHRSASEVQAVLERARAKLFAVREQRVRPGRDEKILTSWNALMIRGLAVAARALNRPDLAAAAGRALDFVRASLWRDARLLATYKDGRAHLSAYLDDYAFLADATLELLQCRWRSDELGFAIALTEVVLKHFEDLTSGGFFFTADDHEALMHRSKSFGDDATPSGNGVAVLVLLRLGHLLGEPRYLDAAERALRAGWSPLERYPQGHATFLTALEERLHPIEIVIIRGPQAEAERWRDELAVLYAPRRLVFAIPNDAADLPAALADKSGAPYAVAYVCRGMSCSAPLTSLEQLVDELKNNRT